MDTLLQKGYRDFGINGKKITYRNVAGNGQAKAMLFVAIHPHWNDSVFAHNGHLANNTL